MTGSYPPVTKPGVEPASAPSAPAGHPAGTRPGNSAVAPLGTGHAGTDGDDWHPLDHTHHLEWDDAGREWRTYIVHCASKHEGPCPHERTLFRQLTGHRAWPDPNHRTDR